jgi:hypothetical protein
MYKLIEPEVAGSIGDNTEMVQYQIQKQILRVARMYLAIHLKQKRGGTDGWDASHNPSWSNRNHINMTRKQQLDIRNLNPKYVKRWWWPF